VDVDVGLNSREGWVHIPCGPTFHALPQLFRHAILRLVSRQHALDEEALRPAHATCPELTPPPLLLTWTW
jgi:hypothetical protein